MAVNSVTSNANVAPPAQPVKQVEKAQQADPTNEVEQARRLEEARQEQRAQQARNEQSKPSVNTQGQTTGKVINTTA